MKDYEAIAKAVETVKAYYSIDSRPTPVVSKNVFYIEPVYLEEPYKAPMTRRERRLAKRKSK